MKRHSVMVEEFVCLGAILVILGARLSGGLFLL